MPLNDMWIDGCTDGQTERQTYRETDRATHIYPLIFVGGGIIKRRSVKTIPETITQQNKNDRVKYEKYTSH